MKILIVQLSDMHCKSQDGEYSQKIRKAAVALKALGPVQSAVVIFSGDLTNSASKNEFKAGKKILKSFLSELQTEIGCKRIPLLIVPGNHDMFLPDGCRDFDEILTWNKDEHLDEELDRLSKFFEYAHSQGCFTDGNNLYHVKTIDINGVKIQACLLNSAPYSTRKPNDKQIHYFPPYVIEKISRDPSAHLKFSIMHHSYEWCEWSTKEMLKKSFSQDDIVFFGHDHLAEALSISNGNGNNLNIVVGGQFSPNIDSDTSFNAVIYDSETAQLEKFELNWKPNHQIFVPQARGTISGIPHRYSLVPTDAYLDHFLADKQQLSPRFTDYYVMPKLIVESETFTGNNAGKIAIDDIFDILQQNGIVKISGKANSGKSSLIKFLYHKSIEKGYFPLYIEKKDYDNRIDKMFRDLFELQYGKIEYGYEAFLQTDFFQRIVFVDDFDHIQNDKARENLFEYIVTRGGLLIYSTGEDASKSLTETVKERLEGKEIYSLKILPFYKETRDELINNICKLEQYKRTDKTSTIIMALDYMVQGQAALFTLNPGNLIQYIKFFLNSEPQGDKGSRTLSLVFETNINNSIIACTSGADTNIYLAVLGYLAYKMYFSLRSESVTIPQLEQIICEYNNRRRTAVNPKNFCDACQKAHILTNIAESFDICFCDKNTFAYFVAKYINQSLERDPANQADILYIMNHICFGINDTIVLFLSYIRSNFRIILKIASASEKLLGNYPELDFDVNNVPFLRQYRLSSPSVPNEAEKKQHNREIEKIEEAKHESVKFRKIFDYNDADAEKEDYKILRALKYTQIIGRALVDQYGNLENDELDIMVEALYRSPQKILYAILKQYQDHYGEIIAELKCFADRKIPEEKLTEEKLQKIFNEAAIIFVLNVMNDIGYNASNINTVAVLDEMKMDNTNHFIQNLIMWENSGNTDAFIEKALGLRRKYPEDKFVQSLIAQIARKHIIYTPQIDHRQVDKLTSGEILSPKSKKDLLLGQQGKKDQKE